MNWFKTAISVFVNAVKTQYIDFKGRTKMMDFWQYLVIYFIINFVLSIIDSIVFIPLMHVKLLSSLYGLAVLLPTLGIAVRRMTDVGKPAWFIIIPFYNLYLWAQPSKEA